MHMHHCMGVTGLLTKLLLAPVPVEVDPQLAADVVFDTRVFLVVQPVKCTTHHSVHLKMNKMCESVTVTNVL